MEDDVEVELELEKQLSLAHEMFWQQRNSQQELLNNFYQGKENNFGGDDFRKNQSNISTTYTSFSPCLLSSCTSQIWEGKYYHSNVNLIETGFTANTNNMSITKLTIRRAYSIIQKLPCFWLTYKMLFCYVPWHNYKWIYCYKTPGFWDNTFKTWHFHRDQFYYTSVLVL